MAFPAPGKLPKNTGLSQLGYSATEIGKLTPAAAALTKGDLLALGKWGANGGKGAAPAHLTINDINSLTKAFGTPNTKMLAMKKKAASEGTTYCCCCSPCCCCTAAAEISPVRCL